MKWHSANKGFTILEVLLAIFILVMISFSTYEATTRTFRLRDVLSVEGEFYNSIRLAVSIMQRDIENAYTPIAMRPTLKKKTPESDAENPVDDYAAFSAGASEREIVQSEFFSDKIDKFGIRPTRLFGSDNKILFVSASNMRMYQDSPESEFSKVRYFLEQETDKDYEPGLSTLVRSSSTDVFIYNEDRDEKVKKYKLLHGVQKIKFRYYRKDKDQWFDSWDTSSSDTSEIFPDIIELQIDVSAPRGLKFQGRYQIRPEVPLYGIPSTL